MKNYAKIHGKKQKNAMEAPAAVSRLVLHYDSSALTGTYTST